MHILYIKIYIYRLYECVLFIFIKHDASIYLRICLYIKYIYRKYNNINIFKIYTVCVCIYIYIENKQYT